MRTSRRSVQRIQFLATVAVMFGTLASGGAAQVTASVLIPAAVQQAVRTRFPTATKVEWKVKTDRNYEAEFTRNGTGVAVKFDSTGKWLETESAIAPSKLPAAVTRTVRTQFEGYRTIETQSLLRWDDPALIFELHLENKLEVAKVQFDGNGAILTRSSKPKPKTPED